MCTWWCWLSRSGSSSGTDKSTSSSSALLSTAEATRTVGVSTVRQEVEGDDGGPNWGSERDWKIPLTSVI